GGRVRAEALTVRLTGRDAVRYPTDRTPKIHGGSMSPKEVLEFAKKNDACQLDMRFTDIPGLLQHISYPINMLNADSMEEGFGIDGSSIRGWAAINESDMLLIPDSTTAYMDPFSEIPTLVMTGDVIDPITRQHYDRDPRWIAKKAELFLQNSGVADIAYFGAEAEFFIFDNVRFDQNARSEEHTSELQSPCNLVCRLLLEKKKNKKKNSE